MSIKQGEIIPYLKLMTSKYLWCFILLGCVTSSVHHWNNGTITVLSNPQRAKLTKMFIIPRFLTQGGKVQLWALLWF